MMVLPQSIFANEDVGEDHEFSHDGGDGELGLFAGLAQPPIECGQAGMEAGCCDGSEVEGGAHMGTPAADAPFARPRSAVAGERGEAGQQAGPPCPSRCRARAGQ